MRNRNRRFSLWLNETEFNHLEEQAEISGLKKEPFIRKLIMSTEIRPRPPDEYRKILFELSAIGNNINQIAHIANAEEHISTEKINEAVRLVDRAVSLVRRWEP